MLDKTYAERPDFEGAKWVMSPPLRDEVVTRKVLWDALRRGHRRHGGDRSLRRSTSWGRRRLGRGAFTAIPNGIPNDRGPREPAVHVRRLAAASLVPATGSWTAASTRAAQNVRAVPAARGAIAVGADADLVVYDPTLSRQDFDRQDADHVNVDYSGFEGFEIDGRPSVVTVRGQVAVKDGAFVGDPGRGQLLRREPVHG
jgi:dihydropyrimidinase